MKENSEKDIGEWGPFECSRLSCVCGLKKPVFYSLGPSFVQATTPLSCHCLLAREFERVGMLRYKNMLDPQQWKEGFFVLQKSNLFICPRTDGAAEDIINLKRLQELSELCSYQFIIC